MNFTTKFDPAHNIITLNGVPVSLHCHHYNCGLLRVIEKFPHIDAHNILIRTAAEEFCQNFKSYFADQQPSCTAADALRLAAVLYSVMGFGKIDLSQLGEEGGTASSDSSYFVVGWLAKYGRRPDPVCYVTCGFIAGILAAVFKNPPDAYEVQEMNCLVTGGDCCAFSVRRRQHGR
ncbi:MAG: hypothetical protein ACOY4W_17480 [Thermodesulfobacteriota bacterium]